MLAVSCAPLIEWGRWGDRALQNCSCHSHCWEADCVLQNGKDPRDSLLCAL